MRFINIITCSSNRLPNRILSLSTIVHMFVAGRTKKAGIDSGAVDGDVHEGQERKRGGNTAALCLCRCR